MYNKQSLEKMGWDSESNPDGFLHYISAIQERDRIMAKQWHLTSTQLGIMLGVSGVFWLILGMVITSRVLLAWACVGTWR